MTNVKESLKIVKSRIESACIRAGRDPSHVRLIGVTKGVSKEKIFVALDEGLKDIGENYIQEAREKFGYLKDKGVTWHMIGHIQSNKAKYIPHIFTFVHSVDRIKILEALDSYKKPLKVLFQVNLSGEESKWGVRSEEELLELVKRARDLKYVEPLGLMTMPPFSEDPEKSRPYFRRLRELLHSVNEKLNLNMRELSMGMSQDFEIAIEEGATMVRIGTAIFGERR